MDPLIREDMNVLIVDDVTSNLLLLTQMVKRMGYIARPVTNGKQAREAIEICKPCLILLDISMPDINGFEFCNSLKSSIETRDIPIIFISAMNSISDRIHGLEIGAVDFISKPFELEEVAARINSHIKNYLLQMELETQNHRLQITVKDQVSKILNEQANILTALLKSLDLRVSVDGAHLKRVGKNARLLAMSLQFCAEYEDYIDHDFIQTIEVAAPLHDIGMLRIPDPIFMKPKKLEVEEYEIVKTHAVAGGQKLQEIEKTVGDNHYLTMAMEIANYHHERYDGTGYPYGLKERNIPLSARIVSIVDVFDILKSDTPYRKAYSYEDCIRIIQRGAGKEFDPDIVAVFLKIQKQLYQ